VTSPQPAARREPGYPISSVGNALELLKLFGQDQEIRVADGARALGVSPSTAHRLLAMLVFHGFVTQDVATRGYYAGPALLELGMAVVRGNGLTQRARPLLQALRTRVDETVSLAVLDGAEVLVVDAAQPDRVVHVAPRVGHRSPAHWNATGKALLAELEDDEIARIYSREKLVPATARTVPTRTALLRELERVRELGFATNLGEFEDEMGAVGAAVHSPTGQAIAGLAVTALLTRVEPRVDELAALVLETVAKIEQTLT